MTHLSVNINKIATLRNARGGNNPNVVQVAKDCERFGANGITVHPRPDERHITTKDVYDLRPVVRTEFNIEGYPDERFMKLIQDIRPEQVTLVPDPPDVLTSNAGWDTVAHVGRLTELAQEFKRLGISSSVFVDTRLEIIEHAAKAGFDRIELYTEPYALHFFDQPERAVEPFVQAAEFAQIAGLSINAGHDLSLDNLRFFKENVPYLAEVSIGHALISDALYLGLENAIQRYLYQLRETNS